MKKSFLKQFLSIMLVFSIVATMTLSAITVKADVANSGFNPYYSELIGDGSGVSFAGGDGTFENPYIIQTAEQLAKVCKSNNVTTRGKYYSLANDIYLNGNSSTDWSNVDWANGIMDDGSAIKRWLVRWNDAADNAFEGTFNGNGHFVYGIFNDAGSNNGYTALFPNASKGANIENVIVDHSYIYCKVSGGIIGGIVGDNSATGENPVITKCGVGEDVTLKGSDVGGLIARMGEDTTITNCYFIGNIPQYDATANSSPINGFVGNSWKALKIVNSYTLNYAFMRTGNVNHMQCNDTYSQVEQNEWRKKNYVLTDDQMKGMNAKTNMTAFDWTNTWQVNENGYPTLYFDNKWKEPDYDVNNTAYNPYYSEVIGNYGNEIPFAGGNGTEEDPYIIETPSQLAKVCKSSNTGTRGVYYVLANDIYLNGNEDTVWEDVDWEYAEMDDGKEIKRWLIRWGDDAPNAFEGNLDGQGHTVYGIFDDAGSGTGYTALFPNASKGAVITNLNVDHSYIHCKVAGAIVGGMVGDNSATGENPVISKCGVGEDVTLKGSDVGGLIARMGVDTTITNCYFIGNIPQYNANTNAAPINGFVGNSWVAVVIKNSYTLNYAFMRTGNAGHMQAIDSYAQVSQANWAWNNSTTVLTDAQMKGEAAKANMTALDWKHVWKTNENGYPTLNYYVAEVDPDAWNGKIADSYASGTGTKEDPYIISTTAQLAKVVNETSANSKGKFYALSNDIVINKDFDNPVNWYGVDNSNSADSFSGTFDGNGYTVSGLYFSGNGGYWSACGLFPHIGEGAHIKNIVVKDFNINYSGAAVGSIVGTITTNKNYTDDPENLPTITACFVDETVRITGANVGGIVGIITGEAEIADCYFNGVLSGSGRIGAAVADHWSHCVSIYRFIAFNYQIAGNNQNQFHYYSVYTTGIDYNGNVAVGDNATYVSKEDMKNNAMAAMPNLNWKDGFLTWTKGENPIFDASSLNNYHQYQIGDVNCDGNISTLDLVAMKKGILEIDFAYNADVNLDATVNVVDLVVLKKAFAT